MPKPTQVAEALWTDRALLLVNAWVTVQEVLAGYAVAIVVGVVLAALIHGSRLVESAIYPWLVVSQMVPIPAVIGAVFAEWVGSSEGLGHLILVLNNQTATAEMFAVITVLAAIGIGLFALVSVLERLLLPWYFEERREERRAGPEGTPA